jgi:hypothetical protein
VRRLSAFVALLFVPLALKALPGGLEPLKYFRLPDLNILVNRRSDAAIVGMLRRPEEQLWMLPDSFASAS